MSTPAPPGWYPDPQRPGQQRWWDGHQWTEHLAPLAPTPGPGPSTPPWSTRPRLPYASFGQRAGAAVIDGLILTIPAVIAIGLAILLIGGIATTSFSSLDDVAADGAGVGISLGFTGGLIVLLLVGQLVLVLGQALYAIGFEGGRLGQTIGKWALGIRVVDADGTATPAPGTAFLRYIVRSFGSQFLFLGYLWMLWDEENRTWHDLAADTRVVVVTGNRVPFATLLRSWRLRRDRT